MRRLSTVASLAVLLASLAAPGAAQQGELQLGPLVGYASQPAFGTGAGVVAGLSLGRIVYVGVRWLYFFGGTETVPGSGLSEQIKTRVYLYSGDFGLVLPAGRYFEIVPGFSLGAARFQQPASNRRISWEFLAAPSLAVHTYVAGIVLIPEVQYFTIGSPDNLDWPTAHRGWMPSLRLVIPIEIGRIRY